MATPVEHGDPARVAGMYASNLESNLRQGVEAWEHVPASLTRIITGEHWRHFVDPLGKPHDPVSFEDFVTAEPFGGLGTTIAMLRDVVGPRDADALVLLNNALKNRPGRRQSSDNVTRSLPTRGHSRAGALDRLQRQRPDLYDKVKSGELPSANAAMIEAGFRHRTITVRIDDIEALRRTLRRHLSEEQWSAMTAD